MTKKKIEIDIKRVVNSEKGTQTMSESNGGDMNEARVTETESGKADRETDRRNANAGMGRRSQILGMAKASVAQGVLWHEILGEPMCKRRRKR